MSKDIKAIRGRGLEEEKMIEVGTVKSEARTRKVQM